MCEAVLRIPEAHRLSRAWLGSQTGQPFNNPKRHEGWELQEVCLKDGELASDERNRVGPIGFHSSVVASQI